MKQIDFVYDGAPATGMPLLLRLECLDRGDDMVPVTRGWTAPGGYGDYLWSINMETHNPWHARPTRDHSAAWAYVFYFADTSVGVANVNRVNAALRALGARLDPRGDET